MKRLKVLALGVTGVVLPVMLVFSAYLIASGSIGAAGSEVPPVPQNRVTSPQETPTNQVDDRGGRCSEAEHQNDPECLSETPSEDRDNSGPGSGPEPEETEDPEEDKSGPGSDNSGPGSDNSGPGSDNSGSGSGSGGGDD
jgi:hypothetical protein